MTPACQLAGSGSGEELMPRHPLSALQPLKSVTTVPLWRFSVPACLDNGDVVKSRRTRERAGFSPDSLFPPSDRTRWPPPPLSSGRQTQLWSGIPSGACQAGEPEALKAHRTAAQMNDVVSSESILWNTEAARRAGAGRDAVGDRKTL